MKSLSRVGLFATPWTVAYQTPLSMGFSRQEYWSGLPCLPPEDLPNTGIEHRSPILQTDSLPSEPPSRKARLQLCPMQAFGIYFYRCCSVAKSCLTLCDPMDCSTPFFPVLHYLLELAQIHVHQVGDAIQPSRPLSSPSPPALSLSQHQGLFQ